MLFEVESILINERVLKRTIDLNLFCVKRKLTVLISFFFFSLFLYEKCGLHNTAQTMVYQKN